MRSGIEAVAVDMWEVYIQSVKKRCPAADIVFDLFHVVKAFGKVIDQVRNEEYRRADAAGKEVLEGSKYQLLRRRENLKRDQSASLEVVLSLNERLHTMHYSERPAALYRELLRSGMGRKHNRRMVRAGPRGPTPALGAICENA